MTKQATSRTRLLKRKLDSRLTRDSDEIALEVIALQDVGKDADREGVRPMKTANQVPMGDSANACTELTKPARVNSVPSMVSRKVEKMSQTFQLFIMPFFSCIITECRKAVPVSQGMKLGVFDWVPTPIAAPAQHGVCPVHAEKDATGQEEQVTMVQLRVILIHFSPG